METMLSARTSALCFNKDDFMINDFSVDKFVSNYRKYVSLETLLADLGVYHKILCSEMMELINKDYADFLNLSSNLVGLDKSIKTLSLPLEKLEVAVYDSAENLHEMETRASSLHYEFKARHARMTMAHNALRVIEGVEKLTNLNSLPLTSDEKMPLDILERMALDFNTVQFHLKKSLCFCKKKSFKCGDKFTCSKIIQRKQDVVEEVAHNLQNHFLERCFLDSLHKNDTESVHRILRIFAVIGIEPKAEEIFSEHFVKPYMESHITEENILKYSLSYVYDKILDFISTSPAVLNVTFRRTKKSTDIVLPGFDFLINSIFPTIVHCFDYITPVHIYAHGNPKKFHENYTSTMHFLEKFEHECGDQTSVTNLRKSEAYLKLINNWNLDVYFEIIFSEIAGKFEKCVLEGFVFPKDFKFHKRDSYLVNICKALSECVNQCYNEETFLKPLGHCFFRLNLKLISRFHKLVSSYFFKFDKEDPINPVYAAIIIRDVEMIINEFTRLFEDKIVENFPRNLVEVAFQQSVKLLESIVPEANSVMIKSLIKECCAHLKLISDIPRLYRKTNREVPSKPSSYVALIFNNLAEFISETDSILPVKSKKFCLEEVINGIIIECVAMIRDVLTAVEKMEHSLKILKKRARDKNQVGGPSGITDDDKIRLQLILDITAVEEKARKMELDIDNLKSFKELKDLMTSTEKILPQNF